MLLPAALQYCRKWHEQAQGIQPGASLCSTASLASLALQQSSYLYSECLASHAECCQSPLPWLGQACRLNKAHDATKQLNKTVCLIYLRARCREWEVRAAAVILERQGAMDELLSACKGESCDTRPYGMLHQYAWVSATVLVVCTTQSLDDALPVSWFLLIHFDVLIAYCMSSCMLLKCAWHCSLNRFAYYCMIGRIMSAHKVRMSGYFLVSWDSALQAVNLV